MKKFSLVKSYGREQQVSALYKLQAKRVSFMSDNCFSHSRLAWVLGWNLSRTKAGSERLAAISYALGSTSMPELRWEML